MVILECAAGCGDVCVDRFVKFVRRERSAARQIMARRFTDSLRAGERQRDGGAHDGAARYFRLYGCRVAKMVIVPKPNKKESRFMTIPRTPTPAPAPTEDAPHLMQDLQLSLARTAAGRRLALRWLSVGAMSAGTPILLAACGGSDGDDAASPSPSPTPSPSPSPSPTPSPSPSPATCNAIPEETAGPYPGDGTNTANGGVVNVLTQSGVVRSDIRSSFGSMSGTASGVPLTITLKLVNTASSCASLEGLAVYLWHCTADGNYSLYSSGITNQNYLRGVQVSDASGLVSFTSIFPGCYSGRWPHIHFEVYRSLALATSGSNDIRTSQLALPQAACSEVYNGDSRYSASIRNLAAITLASDNVFGNDSAAYQLATVTGSVSAGYLATLTVGVAV